MLHLRMIPSTSYAHSRRALAVVLGRSELSSQPESEIIALTDFRQLGMGRNATDLSEATLALRYAACNEGRRGMVWVTSSSGIVEQEATVCEIDSTAQELKGSSEHWDIWLEKHFDKMVSIGRNYVSVNVGELTAFWLAQPASVQRLVVLQDCATLGGQVDLVTIDRTGINGQT